MLMLSLVFSSVAISPNSNLNASADSEIWSEHTAESVVSVNNVYSIDTAAELAWVAKQVNAGADDFSGKTIKLTKDIDLDGYQWVPIGLGNNDQEEPTDVFRGNFDGQGYTIKNMHIGNESSPSEYTYAGLFGLAAAQAESITIKNVNIGEGCYIYSSNDTVGGICAEVYAAEGNTLTISNCSNSGKNSITETFADIGGICGIAYAEGGTITISNCGNNGSAAATGDNAAVGGICGDASAEAEGTVNIINCYNSGSISDIDTETSNTVYSGGICGYAYNNKGTITISNCSNSAEIRGSYSIGGVCGVAYGEGTITISNCSNSGSVTATGDDDAVGGICGDAYADSMVTISNCYNSGTLSSAGSDKYTGGVCGYVSITDADADAGVAGGTLTVIYCYYDKDKATNGIGNQENDVAGEVTALSAEQMKAAAGTTSGTGFKVNDKTYYALIDVLNDWVDANSNNGYLYWTIENNGYPVPGSESRPSVNENTNKPSEQKNAWVKVDNNWTYWKDGKQVTGWLQDGGDSWYYCDVNTGFMKTGWFQDGGSDWFYCDANGIMVTGWFQDSDSTWYYFFTKEDATERGNREGAMAANQWVYSNNTWYYLGNNGAFLYAE